MFLLPKILQGIEIIKAEIIKWCCKSFAAAGRKRPRGESPATSLHKAMAQLEKMDRKDVLRKPFAEVFRNMKAENSTLLQALEYGKSTWRQEQTYLNKDGREITTVNTTVPVLDGERVLAAVEIAKNITDIQRMSDTIWSLRKRSTIPENRNRRGSSITFSICWARTGIFSKRCPWPERLPGPSPS